MSCLFPRLVPNPKYKPNKKNGGKPPLPKDPNTLYIPIPCGKCMGCKKSEANGWKIRLIEHTKDYKNGKFVLLTFSDEEYLKLDKEINPLYKGYKRDNAIAALAKARFRDRYRKETKQELHCWLVTELGQTETERIHLHGIIWTDETKESITNLWNYGYCGRGRTWKEAGNFVNGKSMTYITKYIFKVDIKHPNYEPIILCSNGIGRGYTKTSKFQEHKYNEKETRDFYRLENGYKTGQPTYYRNKAYNEEERELLWIQTTNKNTRYIGREKFDTSTEQGRNDYLSNLKYAQKESIKMGYGTPHKKWEQIEYENQLRALKRAEMEERTKLTKTPKRLRA